MAEGKGFGNLGNACHLQVRTTLNMLGPLLNPAGAVYGLIGVYSPSISMLMAESMQQLGTKKSLVVHSQGLDELTPMGDADVIEATQHSIRRYRLEPRDFSINRYMTWLPLVTVVIEAAPNHRCSVKVTK